MGIKEILLTECVLFVFWKFLLIVRTKFLRQSKKAVNARKEDSNASLMRLVLHLLLQNLLPLLLTVKHLKSQLLVTEHLLLFFKINWLCTIARKICYLCSACLQSNLCRMAKEENFLILSI